MWVLAARPWVRPLRLEAALPSAVLGPVDLAAFWRLAWIWASVGGVVAGSFWIRFFHKRIVPGELLRKRLRRPTSLIGDEGGIGGW